MRAIQERFTLMEQRNLKLEEENQQLVERWLRKMAEEAEKMNTANEFYTQMVEAQHKVEVLTKTLQQQQQQGMKINSTYHCK